MKKKIRFCKRKDSVLTLILKEKYPDKPYNLYTIYKVVDNEYIPLYDETFTKDQIEKFYTNLKKHIYEIDKNN